MGYLVKSDVFFTDDPRVIISHPFQFFPLGTMTLNEQLNSVARMGIYIIITSVVLSRSLYPLILIPFILLGLIYYHDLAGGSPKVGEPNEKTVATTSSTAERMPTDNNPFMNYQLADIHSGVPPDNFAKNNQELRENMENVFQRTGAYDDESDIFGRKFSSANFYTVPNNDPVRDPDGAFQNWIGGRGPTCKDNPKYCLVKPERVIDGSSQAPQDRTLEFSIGLDMNRAARARANSEFQRALI